METLSNKIKKEKRPTKKGLIGEIEKLDVNKNFNLLSLTRTNIDNLVYIKALLIIERSLTK